MLSHTAFIQLSATYTLFCCRPLNVLSAGVLAFARPERSADKPMQRATLRRPPARRSTSNSSMLCHAAPLTAPSLRRLRRSATELERIRRWERIDGRERRGEGADQSACARLSGMTSLV